MPDAMNSNFTLATPTGCGTRYGQLLNFDAPSKSP
jgi:hypothetical protein